MTSTAAIVGNWSRQKWRFGPGINAPGPMSPAGSDPDGGDGALIGLTVEIFVNSAWTDISSFVYYRGGVGVSITRGRGDETAQIQPQTARLILDNRDGRFSVRNPNGPYYGQLGRNVPIRVSRLANGIRRYRFYGEVPTWPTASEISHKDVTVSVAAFGMLRRLRAGNQPLRSSMFRAYTIAFTDADFSIVSVLTPVAYWPAEDGSTATQVASGLNGGSPMVVTGTPKFATDGTFQGSAPLPQLNGSVWTGAVPKPASTPANAFQFLLAVPAAGDTNSAVIARLFTTGTVARVDFVYTTAANGTVTMFGYNSVGTQIINSTGVFTATGVNGYAGIMGMNIKPDPTPGVVDWIFSYAPKDPLFSGTVGGGATLSGSIGNATQVVINPGASLTSTAVGHVAVQTDASLDPTLSNVLFDAMNAHNGDTPSGRFLRLCGEQNVPAVYVGATSSTPADNTSMGYQTADTFATLIQQVADALFTPMYETRDQLSLALRSRTGMYNQAAKLTLDMAQNQLSGPLIPLDDDQLTRNDVTVNRKNGSSYEAALTSGTMSTQLPPNGIGPYPYGYDLSLGGDSILPDQAGWRLRFGTVDEPRYPRIPVNVRYFAGTSAAQIAMTNALLTIDIGDRLDVLNPPGPDFPPDPISQIVQGYTETLGNFEHDIVFNCSPASPWRVAFLDDATFGVADTDGSTLGGDYPLGTETSLLVKTTGAATGSPLWTTSAGDFPFDVNVGGERMTVTNITGSSSPQTFTVTRSVNGVVKGQTSGTDVRLWQPAYLSV